MNNVKDKIGHWIAFGAMVLIAISLAIFVYWNTQSSDVLKIKNAPFPVRTIREHPTAGGVVILHVDYCKKVAATGKLRVSFVSRTRELFLPVAEDRQPPACNDTELPVLIPKDLPADKYRIKFRAVYQVNPIKNEIIEEFYSQDFLIVEGTIRR